MSHYIVLAGTTGVGKSTLTRKLANKFHFHAFYEHLDDNPYLADYYAGKGKEICFEMQVYFLGQRVAQQKEIEKMLRTGTNVIHDRSIYEDFHIFTQHQYNCGYISDLQFENYRRLFFTVTDLLYPPDLIIYLHASTERLLQQISQRGREYEQTIDLKYLEQINDLYQEWLERLEQGPSTMPLLPVDVCETDLQGADFESFAQSFQTRLERLKGFSRT
ncbi:deoxynucleoside kinase [bacterium (Candidatus Blackallbacteria) CG17_big_fil_post_rev_8_21_14_2_50_48_46]|uniref:Deoxynucleoside kinase n=1 Tax=bacterium (Candidatus Blackallbacteria) CG17_big_fil_post_rev_8_21_14_2_50_48_46 TaxID=2014261 RepID=A0A2M7G5M0_9BACT|nr:MAG: deoxynucleoside kinase [bacterium (Candidatus Blackallbacteria) CG18_big_fil_WC_8_21_14_2_50_49_26]PIW17255.1 MAG: deoxynucleoside kinase [bacterium (Candidatus Blackallbacteria) CG17_big_fil_post_rev_8_21_14_2_50_48_46]PIW51047.1 MAG: deoxynucleoside kinase [bacterium (Candidatus Blackallbacteria) CG13_big_fil_rev_8_21_14_2_50_49_14]